MDNENINPVSQPKNTPRRRVSLALSAFMVLMILSTTAVSVSAQNQTTIDAGAIIQPIMEAIPTLISVIIAVIIVIAVLSIFGPFMDLIKNLTKATRGN